MKHLIITIAALAATLSATAATPLADIVKGLVPDKRQAVLEVSLDTLPGGALVLRGTTSEASLKSALAERLAAEGIAAADSVRVLGKEMGLVRIPAASLRTRPSHAGEMATQAIMGMPVRILESHGDEWLRIQTPDGYIAWVPASSVSAKTAAEMQAWRANDRRFVVSELWQTHAFTTAEASGPRDVVTDLVLGAIVEATDAPETNGRLEIVLPDGRRGWADAASLSPIRDWADQPFDAQKILTTAYSMEGTPYLWGGTSVKAIDCSGLVKVSYLSNGLILRRDASQQALTGEHLDADAWRDYRPADLMFFGNRDTGRVTHVALYDHDGHYVHSSGRVKRNSVDPAAPDYLYSPLHSVRIHGHEGSDGITRAASHPWYF